MLKQLYNHSSVGDFSTLEQYKAYKAIVEKDGKVSLKYKLEDDDKDAAMIIGSYKKGETVYFYNDFKGVTLSNAKSIQPLNNELLPNETVNKIQFMIKEKNTADLSNSVLFINIDAIRGYKVSTVYDYSTNDEYSIYKYETSDDVVTKIRYLAVDDQRDTSDTNQYILVNYYVTN